MKNHSSRLSRLENPASSRTKQPRQFQPRTQAEIDREQAKRDGILLKMDQIKAMKEQGVNPYMFMPRAQLIETAQQASQPAESDTPETAAVRARILQRLQRLSEAQ